jgi:glycosyltransferase involved in cell wall biosynthesis
MFVLPNLGGGAARVVVTLLRHLDRERFEPHLMVVDQLSAWFRSDVPSDVGLHVLARRRARQAVLAMLATVWRVRPAVVVSTQGYINFILLLAHPLLPRTRLVVREVIGERYLEHYRYRELLYRWYLRLVRRADRIVTQSDAVALEMTARVQRSPGQVRRLHNPVDVDLLMCEGRSRASPFVGPGLHILAAGRLHEQKGFDLLLDAFAGVLAEGVSAVLTILGEGEERLALQAQVQRLGIAEAVNFAGFQDHPYLYFSHADLFVLSSRYEGLPNVLLEALACGCPVVAFDCPHGVREIVRDGVNGLLVPPQDVGALRAALTRLLQSPQERVRLRAGIPATLEPFAASTIARAWEALFDEITV